MNLMGTYSKLLQAKPIPSQKDSDNEMVIMEAGKGKDDTKTPRHHATATPITHDTVVPRHHDTKTPSSENSMGETDMVYRIRQAVMQVGREGGTLRFSSEEKKALNEIVFSYQQTQNIRTSGTELTRIAVNFLLEDYDENGEASLLHQVLVALHR